MSFLLFCILVMSTNSVSNLTVFVSTFGSDDDNCGDIKDPCGTLYHASGLINTMKLNLNNIIVSGQNTTEINYYINSDNMHSHPCLAQPFVETNETVITFDNSFIHKMSDWYPQICINYDRNNTDIDNTLYMFHAIRTKLTINNLFIDMIEYDILFGIIGVINEINYAIFTESKLICNHCFFENIDNTNKDITMIYSARNIELNHCVFTNIHSMDDFIVMYSQTLTFLNVSFSDFTLNESLVHIKTPSINTEGGYDGGQNTVDIKESRFVNIATQIALIYDQYIACDVSIDTVSFYDINSGSIYRAYYQSNTKVNITNANISTSQIAVSTDEVLYSLFEFRFAEEFNIKNISVTYNYDLFDHCEEFDDGSGTIGTNDYVEWLWVKCANPISLIKNEAPNAIINNLDLSINISKHDIDAYKESVIANYSYVFMSYHELRDEHYMKNGLILNDGNLTIDTITIYGTPFSHQIIINSAILFIKQFTVLWDIYGSFDPNTLQANSLIAQSGLAPETTVINSYFNGGGLWSQIMIYNGDYSSYNTQYERAIQAIVAKSGGEIMISNCTFIRIGRYWANIGWAVTRDGDVLMNPLYLEYIDQSVTIEQSYFEGFQDAVNTVFIYVFASYQVILRENLFIVNDEDNYYDVTEYDTSNMYALLWIANNYNVSVYNNDFNSNDINPSTPWISLEANGYNNWRDFWPNLAPIASCVSGNNFSNFAYDFYENNITSCFRPGLYLCVKSNCSHGHFGNMNEELYDKTSHINIDPAVGLSNFLRVYDAYQSADFVYAMDNIQINILHNESWHLLFGDWYQTQTYGVNMLLLDSFIPHNIEIHFATICKLKQYDLLQNNSQYIAHFKLLCDPSLWANDALHLINDSHIRYVDHLTPTQVHFNSTTSTYFPGQKLRFDYQIFDKLNLHCYDYKYTHNQRVVQPQFTVSLSSDALHLNQVIDISEEGACDICDSGVVILGVALYDLHDKHILSINTSIINSNLMLTRDIITLYATSCPIGYGSDPNDFQCLVCPDGTFNLSPNNTDDCEDCHEDINDGVICHSGSILIRRNWWLGFCGSDGSMVTNICPSAYCCQNELFCHFNQTETLCADHRDASIPLCGACVDSYTEAINSPQCMICSREQYTWFVKPIILAVVYTLYLVFFNNVVDVKKKKSNLQEIDVTYGRFRCFKTCINRGKAWYRNKKVVLLCQTLVLRVLLYYEQALGSIMWPTSSYSPYLAEVYAIASVFNLETSFADNDAEPQCLFEGLTSKHKILLALFPWALIVVLLFLAYVYEIVRHHFIKTNRYQCSDTNFAKAFVGLLIICASQLLSVLFKLLNCQKIGIKRVHFYFGIEQCFKTRTMVVSLIFLFIVALIFVVMLYVVCRYFTPKKRENPNAALNKFCQYYKPACYYWEWLTLLRRSLISAYAIFYTWSWYPSILVVVLFICLGLHHKFQPFKTETANTAEYFALCSVIIVITIQTSTTSVAGSPLSDATLAVLSLFVIVPIIAILFYIIYTFRTMTPSEITTVAVSSPKEDEKEMINPSEMYALTSSHTRNQSEEGIYNNIELGIHRATAKKGPISDDMFSISTLKGTKGSGSEDSATPLK